MHGIHVTETLNIYNNNIIILYYRQQSSTMTDCSYVLLPIYELHSLHLLPHTCITVAVLVVHHYELTTSQQVIEVGVAS